MQKPTTILLAGVVICGALFFNQYGGVSANVPLAIIDGGVCTQDAQCDGGSMCAYGACQSAFACKPFMDATWKGPKDLLAGGAFDGVKNPEYLQVVPVLQQDSSEREPAKKHYALRIQGGPIGEHTYERAVLKYFEPTRDVWSGSVLVNLFGLVDPPTQFPWAVVLLGGYTDPLWPQSGAETWWRDFILGAVNNRFLPPARTFGADAYYHSANGPWPIAALTPLGAVPYNEKEWPDRFILVEWYFTPGHNLFVRTDGQTWVQIVNINPFPLPAHQQFRGFAAGWISSYMGGSIDIQQVKLYDSSCLVPAP